MRRLLTAAAVLLCAGAAWCQPKLTPDNIQEIIDAMTLEEKASLCVGQNVGVQRNVGAAGGTRPIERLGIPGTVLADGPAGLRISPTRPGTDRTFYCTGFPIGTLLASSWDTELVSRVTGAMGNEVLEYGVDVLLAPGVNLHRNPLCGRNFEYFSEDPVLSGNMAAAYISGIQSNGVGTSIKHYAANNQETNRNEVNSVISARALRELYLKNFEIAITKSEPWTVMSSYNKLNGKYTQQSHDLLTKVLREDWGYRGIVMTDWGSKRETARAASAGNDLMEPGRDEEIRRLVEAVENGTLTQEELDRNVRRMLEYIVRTPSFRGYRFSESPDLKGHAQVAREAAAESIVLLRNENGALPLKGDERIALYGIGSIEFVAGGTGSGDVNKAYVVNMVEGLSNAGLKPDAELADFYRKYRDLRQAEARLSGQGRRGMFSSALTPEADIPAAAIARQAQADDAAVIVITRNAGEGSDRDISDFTLSATERELIGNVSMAFRPLGKKVIVVLNIGGVIETASWRDMTDAILLPWSPGQEGANAVGDILTGKVNPSGKLPMTFPLNYLDIPSSANFPYTRAAQSRDHLPVPNTDWSRYEEDIWIGYRYFDTAGKAVAYPFGFGLSYTSFSYSAPSARFRDGAVTASVTVTNTGAAAGREVVEVYVSAPEGGMAKPAKELKAFAKTRLLQPGESQRLEFTISQYEMSSYNAALFCWEAAAGDYTVRFCASSADQKASAGFRMPKAYVKQTTRAFAGVRMQDAAPAGIR